MTAKKLTLWFTFVLLLALLSRWQAGLAGNATCSLDGNRITGPARVDLVRDATVLKSFCCVTCAAQWTDRPVGTYWQVYDEWTGEPMDAGRARFVRSNVVVTPASDCRIHVFKSTFDALNHARQFEGRRVSNPLAQPANSGSQGEVLPESFP